MPAYIVEALQKLLDENSATLEPQFGFAKLLEALSLDTDHITDEFPSGKAVWAKVANLKAKRRKQQ